MQVVGLLPETMLLQVIQDLMQHSIPNIQRKSMELLNSFLQQKEHTMVTDPALLGLDCLHNGQQFSLYHLLQPCTFLLWAAWSLRIVYFIRFVYFIPSIKFELVKEPNSYYFFQTFALKLSSMLLFKNIAVVGDKLTGSCGQTVTCMLLRECRSHHHTDSSVQSQVVV